MRAKPRQSALSAAVIGLAVLLIAFDVFLVIMISAHDFPTEIFKSDYPNWQRSVVFTWSDGLILAGLALGHVLVAWAYLRHRSRRSRRAPP